MIVVTLCVLYNYMMCKVPCFRLGRFGTGGLLSCAASCSVDIFEMMIYRCHFGEKD